MKTREMRPYAMLAIKAIAITSLLLFCLFGYLIAAIIYLAHGWYESKFYMSSISPDGRWGLLLEDSGALGYGATSLHVFAFEYNASMALSKKKVLDFQVSNDGKSLNEHNCKISWNNPNVPEISCTGEEQPEAIYRINLSSEFHPRHK